MNRFQQGSLFKMKRKSSSDVWVLRWYDHTTGKRVVYTEARWATLTAAELEDWPGDIRLIHVRG